MQNHFEVSLDSISKLIDLSKALLHKYCQDNAIQKGQSSSIRKFRIDVSDVRKIIQNWLNKYFFVSQKKVQAFYNFKGGTGKTSICFQVANILSLYGLNILVIDADPQGHLSTSFGFDNTKAYHTLYEWIIKGIPFSEIKKTVFEGLDVIPANLSLTRMELALNNTAKREERVKIAVEKIASNYDFVLFDTNPSISLLNRNIITYADVINIVTETQPYSINGLKILLEDMDMFFSQMELSSPDIKIIPNKYEDRSSTAGEAISALNTLYSEYTIKEFAVRKSEDINISAKLGLALPFFCKKNSTAFEDIADLVQRTFITKKNRQQNG